MSGLTGPATERPGRWCWAVGRDPHVAATARERPGAGDAVLCDACELRRLRERGER